MFFKFRQNNSGGSFDVDADRGIAHTVIIEARDHLEANVFAQDVGLYWDGCDSGRDCSCCGDRWYPTSAGDGTDAPEVYGQPVRMGPHDPKSWQNGFVHYLDGRIEPFCDTVK